MGTRFEQFNNPTFPFQLTFSFATRKMLLRRALSVLLRRNQVLAETSLQSAQVLLVTVDVPPSVHHPVAMFRPFVTQAGKAFIEAKANRTVPFVFFSKQVRH